jgi:hypothetical protein
MMLPKMPIGIAFWKGVVPKRQVRLKLAAARKDHFSAATWNDTGPGTF